jgi:Zn-dependent peptidase ImmA (M78 family)
VISHLRSYQRAVAYSRRDRPGDAGPLKGTPQEIEKEANKFSAEFLMPEISMKQEVRRPITLACLAELKAKRRAYELHIITERQSYYLMKQISFRGWKSKERVEIPMERPQALRRIAEVIYRQPINFRQLGSETNFPLSLIKDIFKPYYEVPD